MEQNKSVGRPRIKFLQGDQDLVADTGTLSPILEVSSHERLYPQSFQEETSHPVLAGNKHRIYKNAAKEV